MPVKRITERVSMPFAGAVVDREQGIIRGVKLCGGSSANGRDYPPDVFRRDVGKYEGAAVYADHGRDRSVDRKLGWIGSPRVDADGTPRGDAHLLKSHPLYERVMEAAERNPALFGFSHVAVCETSFGADGRERVEGLRAIESVDLVAEPATTCGLFEGRRPDGAGGERDGTDAWLTSVGRSGRRRPKLNDHEAEFGRVENTKESGMPVTIRALAEWVTRHPHSRTRQILAAKRLAEMDDGAVGDEPAAAALPPDDAAPEDAITGGFKAALVSVIERALAGEMDAAVALKKIKTLLAAHCDATVDDDSDESDDSGANEPNPETPSSESQRSARHSVERPASAPRHRLRRHAEADRRDVVPDDGAAFARWIAE